MEPIVPQEAFIHVRMIIGVVTGLCMARLLSGLARAAVIMAAGGADVMRTPQLATIGAFVRIAGHQPVMRAAHATLHACDLALRNSHRSTSISIGPWPESFLRQFPCLPGFAP